MKTKFVIALLVVLFAVFAFSNQNCIAQSNELHLYGSDDVYLGKLTTNEYHVDSVFNEYGNYGNPYSQTSIWNEYGTYGSNYSDKSAFNDYANNPPEIYYQGVHVGYVTTNGYKPNSISPHVLYYWLEQNGF